jgi:hypothetical protein
MTSVEFWDAIYREKEFSGNMSKGYLRALELAISYFGDITGKTAVNLGCWTGSTFIFLARRRQCYIPQEDL